jgi:SAM-dependent methyltransferase
VQEPYRPESYWEKRFSKKLDISIVGHSGLGYVYNNWLYKARFRAARRALRKLRLDVRQKSVLEIGVGSGAWLPFWLKMGAANVTGVDITAASVTLLSNRFPQLRFEQGNICAAVPPVEGEWDIVTAFDVLFHVTDSADFARSIANVAKLTRSGGVAILSDGFCINPWGPFYHEYHRTYDGYCEELVRVGLQPFHLEPIFYTMTTTLCEPETAHRRLASFTRSAQQLVFRLAARRRTEWANHVVGCGLYAVDGILGRALNSGPSLKLLFARRQS